MTGNDRIEVWKGLSNNWHATFPDGSCACEQAAGLTFQEAISAAIDRYEDTR